MMKMTYTRAIRHPREWRSKRCLAFVLGGGGGRGALQVGAMRALLEAGIKPDLLVGTSIGAVNATGLALWGVDLAGIDRLERTWQDAASACLLDPRLSRLVLRLVLGRPNTRINRQITQFLESKGITADLRFDQITGVRLALIGSDLAAGQPVIYGQEPDHSVLEGILASIALPPWFTPVEKDGHIIIDGGFLSNLPIEPALVMGATEIIALALDDFDTTPGNGGDGFSQYIERISFAISQRQMSLETALAEARGVPTHRIELKSPTPTPIWDFSNHQQLIQTGYEIASQQIPAWVEIGRTIHRSSRN